MPSSHISRVRHYGVPHIDEFPCGRGPAELPRGEKVDSKIVGGREAVKNSWPFMVNLKFLLFPMFFVYNVDVLRTGGTKSKQRNAMRRIFDQPE